MHGGAGESRWVTGPTIVTRVDANDEIDKKILDDEDFRVTLGEFYLRKVYERLNQPT